MLSIFHMPQEILLEIFEYCPSSLGVIELWKTGDRRVQHKVEITVRSIDLVDKSKFPRSKWPACLSRFQGLRRLSLITHFGHLCNDRYEFQASLLALSHELEELTLYSEEEYLFSESNDFDKTASNFAKLRKIRISRITMRKKPSSAFLNFMTRNVTECELFDPVTSLNRAYFEEILLPPRLEILNMATFPSPLAKQNVKVPPSLTTLSCIEAMSTKFPDDIAKFQPTKLRLPHWNEEFASKFLALESLTVWYEEINLALLPPQLTFLDALNPLTIEMARALPRTLTHLNVPFVDARGWDVFPLPNLITLNIKHALPQNFVHSLPSSLKFLGFTGNWATHPALPDSITSIESDAGVKHALPAHLRRLKATRIFTNKRSLLPATLTYLDCHGSLVRRDANLVRSNLTTLKLRHFSEALFSFLPHTLTSLEMTHFSLNRNKTARQQISAWSKMPTGLRSLTITDSPFGSIHTRCLTPLTELRILNIAFAPDEDFPTLLEEGYLPELRSAAFVVEDENSGFQSLPEQFLQKSSWTTGIHRIIVQRRY